MTTSAPYAWQQQGTGGAASGAEKAQQPVETMPQFGATFYPGGVDDYFMPEVVAPAPQRVMPEVPQNMQQDLQRMELEARNTEAPHSNSSSKPNQQTQQEFKPFYDNTPVETMSAPSFSPFPKVKGDNIPPTDEAKEEILYNARQHVLHSNNVNMQLSWARDALTYVEISAEAAARENPNATRAQTPKIEHELKMDAINIVNYLAGQDHPEALFIRSKWMEFGKFGRRPDKKEAYLGYKRAAEQGFGRAEYRMGMLYENSNDFDKAIIHYNKGLELNDSAAAYRLGMMNLLGQHSYRKDYHRGIDLIRQAAETADEDAPQGAYVYGMLISNDLPDIQVPESVLPYDATTAKLYIEKAAYLGFAKAQLKMGQAYELCQLSCDFNPSYSLHYYGLAARQGNSEAALGVSRWFLFGYDGYFAKNEQLAYQYAQQAANEKIHTGYFAMGYFYEIGIYVKKDLSEARRWYEMAADNGNKDARQRLDGLDHNQSLSKEDHETKGLGRIKSQHGSMRGKRPDRFKQNQVMPTLSESDNPRKSPAISPRQNPTIVQDSVEFPDPERMVQKPPAFTINLNNQQNLPLRPSSAAPYPQDDRPAPLNLSRPKSTAPYPEDDTQGARPLSPHYNPNIRPSQGPVSDRPQSAFGIRTNTAPGGGYGGPGGPGGHGGPGGPGGPGNNLYPSGPQAGRGRGGGWGAPNAGWEPQGPGGYPQQGDNYRRDPLPGQPQQGPPHDNWVGGGPAPNPSQNRLQKQNPNVRPPPAGQGGYGPQGNYPPPAGTQPYPARTSSRPTSQGGPDPQRISGDYNQYQRPGSARPDHPMPPQRMDSLLQPQGGPGGRQPMPLKDRPAHLQENTGGRSSAPPGQGRPAPGAGAPGPGQRPPMSSSQSSSTINTTQSAPAKPQGQGPSTFEEMGIPKVKDEDNCVVM